MAQFDSTRRGVVTGGLATVALAVGSARTADLPTLSGRVLRDREGTGLRSAGDPGLPGVLVSNGVDVAVTDGDGRWSLPARMGQHVFVIKPTDWTVTSATAGWQTFARLIDADLPMGDIDFSLRHTPEARRFDVALLADTQPQTMTELGYLRDAILPVVMATNAAFAINHGDVLFDAPDLRERYQSLIAGTGMPWHHCPGNHDMNAGWPHQSFDTWKRTFGPCHYAFQHGGVTFILLNNVARLAGHTPGGHDYRGEIGRAQLQFVARLLQHVPPDDLVVVSMHIPLVGFEEPEEPSAMTVDRRSLLSILSGRPNTLSLAGHTHTTEHHWLGAEDGFAGVQPHHHHVLTAACGSWWSGPFDDASQPLALSRDGTPKGLHVLEVDGHNYRTRFVPAGHTGHAQLRVTLESREAQATDGSGRLVCRSGALTVGECADACLAVNVFDGGPRTSVTGTITACSRQRAAPVALGFARIIASDTSVEAIYLRHRAHVKSWVTAAPCSHLWRAELPPLEAGVYAAAVTVIDPYGTTHATSMVVEVV